MTTHEFQMLTDAQIFMLFKMFNADVLEENLNAAMEKRDICHSCGTVGNNEKESNICAACTYGE